jgi:hypothetical protein
MLSYLLLGKRLDQLRKYPPRSAYQADKEAYNQDREASHIYYFDKLRVAHKEEGKHHQHLLLEAQRIHYFDRSSLLYKGADRHRRHYHHRLYIRDLNI